MFFILPSPTAPAELPQVQPTGGKPYFKILAGLALLSLLALAVKPFVELDEEGNLRLLPWRQEKLEKELLGLQGAEQYVLRADVNGWYPCYSCLDTTHIFLTRGEVWRYGFTTKGENGRYGNRLGGLSLNYETQFEGSIEACLMEERRKIYAYALLPENAVRKTPLIRPPGNKKDW